MLVTLKKNQFNRLNFLNSLQTPHNSDMEASLFINHKSLKIWKNIGTLLQRIKFSLLTTWTTLTKRSQYAQFTQDKSER